MKYHPFGNTELVVSEFGLGTAQIGGPSMIKGRLFGAKPITDKEANFILTLAYESGVTFYDSSDLYGDGHAERRLGAFFNNRDDVVIATKCGFDQNGERRFDKTYVCESVEGSLRRLKRERIDLFQFAKPTVSDIEQEDLLETVLELKKQGKIVYAGISVGTIADGMSLIQSDIWDGFQILYNLLSPEYKALITAAHHAGKGVIIRSPLSSGMLTGRFSENTRFDESDDRSLFVFGNLLEKRSARVDAIKKKFSLTNEELIILSLNFLMSDPAVTTIIPGATSVSQMETNLRVLSVKKLKRDKREEVYKFAKEMAEKYPD